MEILLTDICQYLNYIVALFIKSEWINCKIPFELTKISYREIFKASSDTTSNTTLNNKSNTSQSSTRARRSNPICFRSASNGLKVLSTYTGSAGKDVRKSTSLSHGKRSEISSSLTRYLICFYVLKNANKIYLKARHLESKTIASYAIQKQWNIKNCGKDDRIDGKRNVTRCVTCWFYFGGNTFPCIVNWWQRPAACYDWTK